MAAVVRMGGSAVSSTPACDATVALATAERGRFLRCARRANANG
jgi:hypothetical protein